VTDLWVFDRGESLCLFVPPYAADALCEVMHKYLIMDDARIEDQTSARSLLSLQGPQSGALLDTLLGSSAHTMPKNTCQDKILDTNPVTLFRLDHFGEEGYALLLDRAQAPAAWSFIMKKGAIPTGFEALETRRIEAGVPVMGKELDDKTFPQEAQLLDAISFNKGCYLGQETVARLQFRGHVNRRLTGFVQSSGPAPHVGLVFEAEGKEIGWITSFCGSPRLGRTVALGYLREEKRIMGQSLEAHTKEGTIRFEIAPLPFV
jgi:folate-binding protein YgfZ